MTLRIDCKAALSLSADDASGAIQAIAWPFDTPDRVGDMIERGAFKSAALPLPMLFSHDFKDPIGVWEEATEQPDGLHLKGRLLIESVERAREVHALVKSGAVRGVSIGFATKAAKPRAKGGRAISNLELLEASLVTIPLHPGARITSAKTAVSAIRIAEAINRAVAQISKRN